MTSFRIPSTDQLSRKPSHHTTRTRRASCFIDHWPAPSLRVPASIRTITSHMAEKHLVSRHPLRVLPKSSTHRRLHLQWCHARRDWAATKMNQGVLRDESRYIFNGDDNRVRVWIPRGEHLNIAFALQDTPLPQPV
ncbi:transposable element Tcb2 transposase [Trichonephila clavipes]|nr:transposable element Tcb2 transposase [Trichonephila clavipes]